MIVYLTTRDHRYTIEDFLAGPGAVLAGRMRSMVYDDAFAEGAADIGADTWIFADLERLSPRRATTAARLWRRLAARGCRLLNHPTRILRRFEMLRVLHEQRVNDFDAYRATDLPRPRRWPVFLRGENNHVGPISQLLRSQAALDAAIAATRRRGWPLEGMIAVEFCDTVEPDGLYRKYGVFKVGAAIVPGHMDASRNWVVKDLDVLDPVEIARELDYVRSNPHEAAIDKAFRLARIDFGRIDVGVRRGAIRVWEINTNPLIASDASKRPERAEVARLLFDRLIEAFLALDRPAAG
ncbi:MAG: hypothetical protein AB7O45_04880 [Alphaproteobacteria bacterium]